MGKTGAHEEGSNGDQDVWGYPAYAELRIAGSTSDSNRGVDKTCDEGSAIFRTYEQLTTKATRLVTAFLLPSARVRSSRRSLGLALRLMVRVPGYEVDGRLWLDEHYEGGALFADKLNLEVTPGGGGGRAGIRYGWDTRTPNRTSRRLEVAPDGNGWAGTIPFGRGNARPGISGDLRITILPWNTDPEGAAGDRINPEPAPSDTAPHPH